jgi:hypothetical protein
MDKLFVSLNGLTIATNKSGDKVEQKQSRAIKTELTDNFMDFAKSLNIEIMYDKDMPVLVFDNGLVIGFDFNVKALNTELSILPIAKPKAPKKA